VKKRGESRTQLAVDAALALVAHYLPKPWRLDAALVFTNGRLCLWDQWATLPDADKERITKYLRLRPEALADRKGFLEEAEFSLAHGTRFSHVDGQPRDVFEQSPGKPIAQLLDELLDQLAARSSGARLPAFPQAQDNATQLELAVRGIDFRVPLAHVQKCGSERIFWPELKQAGGCDRIDLDRRRLLKLAGQIDRKSVSKVPYRSTLVNLLNELKQTEDDTPFGECVSISSGPTQMLIAPTGRGKSVLAHVAALELASRGIAVAYVVPDIFSVMEEADRLEREIEALDWDLTVASVNSANSLIAKVEEYLKYDAETDPPTRSHLNSLFHPCQLSAYADPGPHEPGREPCFQLHCRIGKKRETVSCPFAAGCTKFDSFRRAASAEILVVNHAAFLVGKVPIPLTVDGQEVYKMTVMELVFRRCGVVLVDEIDLLQSRAIGQSARQLQLSGDRRVSPVHELLDEFEHARADDKLPEELRVDRLRRHLHVVGTLAPELADLINRGDVTWSQRDKMRLPRSRDAWLAERLFGDTSPKIDRLGSVFDREPIAGDADAEKLQAAVAQFSQRDLDEVDILKLRYELMSVLKAWPRPLHLRRSKVPKATAEAEIADAVILRVVLSSLERVLGGLRYQLTTLEQHELEAAGRVRDALLGYVPWTPSPFGPLGHRVIGFAFRRHGDGPGALHAQVLRGDPHGLIAGLGDVAALALAGRQRVVLGLSATAWFAGSPQSHVLCQVPLLQPDRLEGVTVQPVPVRDADCDGKAVRVSGEAHLPQRLERVTRLSFLMWEQFLRDHLSSLAMDGSTKERARVLLVTGSYREARSAAAALSRAMGGSADANRRIWYVVCASEVGRDPLDVRAIPPREIKSFGASEADVLIAPLSVVARGHNIVFPGAQGRSAIASIFVLVRPVPPTDDVARAIAHMSYETNQAAPAGDTVTARMHAERRHAEKCLREFFQGAVKFGDMPPKLRHAVLCDVLVEMAQLAGRCRRGGTDVRLYLVDGAFHDDHVGWKWLVQEAFQKWKKAGDLAGMERLHRAFLHGMAVFAGWKD